MTTTTKNILTGHGTIAVEHETDGVLIRQDDPMGDDANAVFIPYNRMEAVIAMIRPPSAPKLVE